MASVKRYSLGKLILFSAVSVALGVAAGVAVNWSLVELRHAPVAGELAETQFELEDAKEAISACQRSLTFHVASKDIYDDQFNKVNDGVEAMFTRFHPDAGDYSVLKNVINDELRARIEVENDYFSVIPDETACSEFSG